MFVLLLVSASSPGASFCNFQGRAEASVTAFDGGVVSDHFGQITNVECVHSRKMRLRVNTLENNQQIWTKDVDGDKANMSASMFYSIGFPTCDGQWSSGTFFGTTFGGILISWLDSAVSGLTFGFCLPDGGGDGGVGGCSATVSETTTSVLTAGGVDDAADADSGIGLTGSFERPEGRFLAEEWAVLSSDTGEPRVEFASSEDFVDHVEDALDRYYRPGGTSTTVLVVEAAEHPANHRFMPTPEVAVPELPVDWPSRTGTQEFWFRAEVAEAGGVDRVLVLDSSDSTGNSAIRDALTKGLTLRYVDARRHRTVIFGRATVPPGGRLTVRDSVVLVPQCCCGIDEPFCI